MLPLLRVTPDGDQALRAGIGAIPAPAVFTVQMTDHSGPEAVSAALLAILDLAGVAQVTVSTLAHAETAAADGYAA